MLLLKLLGIEPPSMSISHEAEISLLQDFEAGIGRILVLIDVAMRKFGWPA